MTALLDQLGLDQSFFSELFLIAFLFLVLSRIYFRPFLKLFQIRHQRLVADRKSAEVMLLQAQKKMEEYKAILAQERSYFKLDLEKALANAKEEEAQILLEARQEVKKISEHATREVYQLRKDLTSKLELDVEEMAQILTARLLKK